MIIARSSYNQRSDTDQENADTLVGSPSPLRSALLIFFDAVQEAVSVNGANLTCVDGS
jgi:hypothetical protein